MADVRSNNDFGVRWESGINDNRRKVLITEIVVSMCSERIEKPWEHLKVRMGISSKKRWDQTSWAF
jgi:hypothetical protein